MLRARDLFCLGERRSCSSTREMADSLLVRVVGVAVVIRGDLEGCGPGAAQACRFSEVRCPGEPEGIRSPGLQGTASIAGRGQCPLITLLASRHPSRRDAYAGRRSVKREVAGSSPVAPALYSRANSVSASTSASAVRSPAMSSAHEQGAGSEFPL